MGSLDAGSRCQACGLRYSLDGASRLGATPSERARRAHEYSLQEGIDLASAYSVLIGIMPRDRAPSITRAPAGERSEVGGRQSPNSRRDRVATASTLAHEYDGGLNTASRMADAKLAAAGPPGGRTVAPPSVPQEAVGAAGSSSRFFPVFLLVTLPLLGISLWLSVGMPGVPRGTGGTPTAASPAGTVPQNAAITVATQTRTDPSGRLAAVTGAEPIAVLNAFCEATGGRGPRKPVDVLPAGEGWTGYYREDGALYAITIRKDFRAGRWTTGNGVDPVPASRVSGLGQLPDPPTDPPPAGPAAVQPVAAETAAPGPAVAEVHTPRRTPSSKRPAPRCRCRGNCPQGRRTR